MTVTMKQWRQAAQRTPIGTLHFHILFWDLETPSYTDWVDIVERALFYQVQLLAGRRHRLFKLGEDALTTIIELCLHNLNLNASAKVINGNVDLAIEYGAYHWLGEAKLARDVTAIFHGYQQLISRYTTGLDGQNVGGMLLYCQHDAATNILAAWNAALANAEPNSNIVPGPNVLSFRSKATCTTGLPLSITHVVVPLRQDPQEKKKKLPRMATKAAKAAKKAAKGAKAKSKGEPSRTPTTKKATKVARTQKATKRQKPLTATKKLEAMVTVKPKNPSLKFAAARSKRDARR